MQIIHNMCHSSPQMFWLRDSLSEQISRFSNYGFHKFMDFDNIFTTFTEQIRRQKNENWNAQIYFQN